MKLPIYILIVFLFSCGGKHVQFDGAVLDSAGNPVENAEVQFIYSEGGKSQMAGFLTDLTDANGVFALRTKDGYRRVDRIVAVHPNKQIKTNTVDVPSSGKSGVVLSFN